MSTPSKAIVKALGIASLVCCAFLVSACVSQENTAAGKASKTASKPSLGDEVIGELETAFTEYEQARAAGDAPAMVSAALKRLDVSRTLLSESAATRLSEKTIEMIRLARAVAADNKEMQARIDKLLAKADLGPAQILSGTDNLFGKLGNFGSAFESRQLTTYILAPMDGKLIRLRVSSDNGAIVYVEAPAGSGVTLQVALANKAPLCSDSSGHGMLICRWRPPNDGVVNVSIHNASPVEVPVLMISNQSVAPGN